MKLTKEEKKKRDKIAQEIHLSFNTTKQEAIKQATSLIKIKNYLNQNNHETN